MSIWTLSVLSTQFYQILRSFPPVPLPPLFVLNCLDYYWRKPADFKCTRNICKPKPKSVTIVVTDTCRIRNFSRTRPHFSFQIRVVGEQFVVKRDLDNRPLRHPAGLFCVQSPSKGFAGRQLGPRKGAYVHGNYRVGDRPLDHLQVVRPAVRQASTDQHETGKRLYYAPVLSALIIDMLCIYGNR